MASETQLNLALFCKVRRTLPWLEPRGSDTGNAAALAKHIELSLKVVQVLNRVRLKGSSQVA